MTLSDSTPQFESLLDYLKRTRGFNFTGYKRASLARRINRRMEQVGVSDYEAYIDYLEVHPDEFEHLFDTILINHTGFFRDVEAWNYLAEEILPRLIEDSKDKETIRCWSAGCASGEEAYTLAMLLAEQLGGTDFIERVKIYATDLDEDALQKARFGIYSLHEVEGIPPSLLAKYFEKNGELYTFRKDLRRSVIFGRHNLIQDSAISHIALLMCRNVLMYFNAEAQARVMSKLHFALNETGILFLGKAEMMLSHSKLFMPVSLRHRVFKKLEDTNARSRMAVMMGNEDPAGGSDGRPSMREAAFDSGPVGQLVVDGSGNLRMVNSLARRLFDVGPDDLGHPFHELQVSYRPAELRSMIDEAYNRKNAIVQRDILWRAGGEDFTLDIYVVPLPDGASGLAGVSISFVDVTSYRRIQIDLENTRQELETSNEELQSTLEELETTNEELQSTNEELQTMNEEMQSTNEELQAINDEMREQAQELDRVNVFLQSILSSIKAPAVDFVEPAQRRPVGTAQPGGTRLEFLQPGYWPAGRAVETTDPCGDE